MSDQRSDCCADLEIDDLTRIWGSENESHKCMECGATYSWDGTMMTAGYLAD